MVLEVDYCRACMAENPQQFINMSDVSRDDQTTYAKMFLDCTNIDIFQDDLPKKLCLACSRALKFAFDFKRQSLNTHEALIEKFKPRTDILKFLQVKTEVNEGVELVLCEDGGLSVLKEEADNDDDFSYDVSPTTPMSATDEKKPLNKDQPKYKWKGFYCYSNNCKELFDSANALANHLAAVEGKADHLFRCDYCEKEFPKRVRIRQHILQYHKEMTCSQCNELVMGKYFFMKHERNVHKIFRSELDTERCIGNKVYKNRHKNYKHSKDNLFKCNICEKWLSTKAALQNHVRVHKTEADKKIKIEDRDRSDDDQCKYKWKGFYCYAYGCHELFNSISELNSHLQQLEGDPGHLNQCDICKKQFTKRTQLRAHLTLIHKEMECPECHETIIGRYNLNKHEKLVHGADTDVSTPCPICNKVYRSRRLMQIHKSYKHLREKEFKYPCELCGKVMGCKWSLKSHMKMHLDNSKPFACETCGKAFRSRGALNCHLPTHAKENKVECDICGIKLKNPNYLPEHKKLHSDKYEVS